MDDYLTTKEAAKYLGVGTTSIKRWADEQLLACRKTAGGHRRFSRLGLDRFRKSTGTVSANVTADLPRLSRQQLDEMQMGVVQISDDGTIIQYNKWEARLSGLAVSKVTGLNFFHDVAVCTNNDIIYGAFKRGVTKDELDVTIPYTFTYRMRPTNVIIRLFRHADTKTNWILVEST